MKRLSAFLASVPLVVSSIPAVSGELQFKVPTTDRAAQSAELLARAAYALDDVVAQRLPRGHEGQLSNLWVFPTRDANTVFARYALTSADATSQRTSRTEHLALVELRTNGTVKVQQLSEGETPPAHWSASIGTGRTSDSSAPKAPAKGGVPGPAHWTASIGTGHPSTLSSAAVKQQIEVAIAANSHWTAKIGTARARQ